MKFSDAKVMTLNLLGDEVLTSGTPLVVSGATYTASLLKDAIHAALDAILPWVWKRKVFVPVDDPLTPEDESAPANTYRLPSDLFRVESVVVGSMNVPPFMAEQEQSGLTWMLYPSGYITFNQVVNTSAMPLKVYYAASFAKPALENDELETPEHVSYAVCLYAASWCLLPRAVEISGIRQYGTRIDSGNPEHNPVAVMSDKLYRRFEAEMAKIAGAGKGAY